MTESQVAVSICMPTYNGASYLLPAIKSALSQTHQNFELLIVDDGSSDDTVTIAQDFARADKRIKIHLNRERLGLGGNWNRCLDLANGEWIKFLFQDDLLHEECVARMIDVGSRSGALLVACDRSFEFSPDIPDEFRQDFLKKRAEHSLANRFGDFAHLIEKADFANQVAHYPEWNCVGEPTVVMFRRDAIQKFGYFNTELIQLIDWEFWARLATNDSFYYLPETLATFRIHGTGTSLSNRSNKQFRASYLDPLVIQHDLLYSPYYVEVRNAAKTGAPKVDLARNLFETYRAAKSAFDQRQIQSPETAKTIAQEWNRIRSMHPRLKYLSLTYFPSRVTGKLSKTLRRLN
jgi:glycosyltransferase involved in cell wall biosynthesis